ncbi:GNAT family N-acetyltransferase [Solitalea koreensis]|uniref:Acetyltransferase (GNAT) domain-containing protein n=1 Tax=Solitalea koreensis TaxID=543615 RepID=A0A521ANF7_9SPHI|nr:GNAT family N-acetyltransferase [Solitalea koreensis]SMO36335.1 Acetyltransferase (GNAT) domain-containing protein [Solitalea koreensis]
MDISIGFLREESVRVKDQSGTKTSKERYRSLCKTEDSIPLFSQDWWLDMVCGEHSWDVKIIESEGEIIAAWPIYIKRKWGFVGIVRPPFTPYLGCWIKYPTGQDDIMRMDFEIEVYSKLIATLPKFDHFSLAFDYDFHNWCPFYWQGFKQTIKYSYVIEDIGNWEQVLKRFSKTNRQRVKKGQQNMTVKYDLPPEEFYNFHVDVLRKIGRKIKYSFELFKRIHDAALAHGCGRVLYAVDANNKIHAAVFDIRDEHFAYSIFGVFDRECNASGASTYLSFEAIKYASQFVNRYDLGWTMNAPLGHAKRHEGAVLMPFHNISKNNSMLLKVRSFSSNKPFS